MNAPTISTRALRAAAPNFLTRFGGELEGWTHEISCVNFTSIPNGSWEDDAGYNLAELVTDPMESVEAVMSVFRAMLDMHSEITLIPKRPKELQSNSGKWHKKPRYTAMHTGLRREAPSDWHRVHRFTNVAALQISVSGEFDPVGHDGLFLINMWNAIAPYVAAVVHEETGLGKGHLGVWRRFADQRRFPNPEYWFSSPQSFKDHHELVPRLIVCKDDDRFEQPALCERQQFGDPADHGVMWQFARPKPNQAGQFTHLELRVLPSMPFQLAQYYLDLVTEITNCLLLWFKEHNRSRPVSSHAAAAPAYEFLSRQLPRYVPEEPLSPREWRLMQVQG